MPQRISAILYLDQRYDRHELGRSISDWRGARALVSILQGDGGAVGWIRFGLTEVRTLLPSLIESLPFVILAPGK